ncbi:16S rRNA (guanine(1207)-N(2))-methyltransferase RsmC [Buchnera aphidicola]|uniref:16S rRNA (guanine(1207)-N(2))-methyltransferase RsmC n=1 Tax=Buchnera aphidicola TaxID=9 RepID=UPI0031B6E1CA
MNKIKQHNSNDLLIKNKDIFLNKKVFFSGLSDSRIIKKLNLKSVKIHTYRYDVWKKLKKKFHVSYSLITNKNFVKNSEILIFYWKKNVLENIFQLISLVSVFTIKSDVYIIGKNKSGIKSSISKLKKWIIFKKIDFLRKCSLVHGKILKKIIFLKEQFIKVFFWKNLYIYFFPGIFSYNKVDEGSKLLLSTFTKKIKGDILDVGCGNGILSAFLLQNKENKIKVTLTDIHLSAIESSKLTFKKNGLQGKILSSDIYSNIKKKFDLIISNIPIHEDLNIELKTGISIIKESINYLKSTGELRIVINSFINISETFKKNFKNYKILKKTKRFIVFQGFRKDMYEIHTRSGI